MIVVGHAPHAWFFLTDGNSFYLDVNCEVRGHSGSTGISLLLLLTAQEAAEYRNGGFTFLERLAGQVSRSPRDHFARDVSNMHRTAVSDAIGVWKAKVPA